MTRLRFLLRPRTVGICLLAALAAVPMAHPAPVDYAAMRAERADVLTAPDGWFSLVALAPLLPGKTTVGSAPGSSMVLQHVPAHLLTLETAGTAVRLAAVAPGVTLGGQPAYAGEMLPEDEDEAGAVQAGRVTLWAIERGGQRYLRVKDPEAPERLHFHGLRWYAPAPRYRIEAKWIPYATPHMLAIVNKLGQVSREPVPGYVEFTVDGHQETLVPTVEDGNLFFVFTDRTARTDTDGGGRFLTAARPSNGLSQPGTVLLDFNDAVNPPCAYSPYATCPQAPKENRLNVVIPAGEKRYD